MVLPSHGARTKNSSSLFLSVLVKRLARKLVCVVILLAWGMTSPCYAGVLVIGNKTLEAMDGALLRRIYTGRVVIVQGKSIQPINLKTGNGSRDVFMKAVIKQSDDDYVAYWIVRRAIGKGTPPPELESDQEVLDYVRSTSGAVGYIDEGHLTSGVKILLSLP
jgi:ABC-type phosphate transport system substrate-binding protein